MPGEENLRKLLASPFPVEVKDADIRTYFSQFGEIEAIEIKQRETKCLAHITFTTEAAVDATMKSFIHYLPSGKGDQKKKLFVRRRLQPGPDVTTLYVSGIGETKKGDLLDYFTKFGTVENVELRKDRKTSENIAFVRFACFDSVDKLVLMKTHTVAGKAVKVERSRNEPPPLSKRMMQFTGEVVMPAAVVGAVIGKGGTRLSKVQGVCDVVININEVQDQPRLSVATILGSEQRKVQRAVEMLSQSIREATERLPKPQGMGEMQRKIRVDLSGGLLDGANAF